MKLVIDKKNEVVCPRTGANTDVEHVCKKCQFLRIVCEGKVTCGWSALKESVIKKETYYNVGGDL